MTPGVILRSWRATWSANVPLPRYHLLHGSQQRRWKRSSSANDGPTTARSDLQIPTQPSHRRTGSSNPVPSSAESRKLPYRIKGMCPGGVVDQYHSHIRGVWRPDWSRAVGGDEYIEPKARGHTVDLACARLG